MSQPSGKKGGSKGPPKDKNSGDDAKKEEKDKAPPQDKDDQVSTNNNNGVNNNGEAEEGAAQKPQSAGAVVRDAGQKVLSLCQKSEWSPVDQVLKSIEKSIASAGEDANTAPLAGIADPATGMTPLMYAVKDNKTSLIERLIELGADVTARNNVSYEAQLKRNVTKSPSSFINGVSSHS
ncbi:uncharacterized protein LOC112905946 [Agrilus planipennis]|uniref:Uncharacterized protein LOC112905946 n=1 Tax=Agrilus planipennis TaxID=224129 RepID=A0A7F5RGT0_AGRPL|nr:uncharacterized protein LOC112905946 [Agrilus planipennis]